MCRFNITTQPAFELDATLSRVPHSTDLNLRIIQRFPTARHPTDQVLLNVCLSRDALKNLGHVLVCET